MLRRCFNYPHIFQQAKGGEHCCLSKLGPGRAHSKAVARHDLGGRQAVERGGTRRQAGCGQWQKPLLYLPGRSHRSRRMRAPLYWMPRPAKVRAHTSTASSNGKYGSMSRSISPALWYMPQVMHETELLSSYKYQINIEHANKSAASNELLAVST